MHISLFDDFQQIPLKLRLIIFLIVKIIYDVSDFHYILQYGLNGDTIHYPVLVAINMLQIVALHFEIMVLLKIFKFYLAVAFTAFLILTSFLLTTIIVEPDNGILDIIREVLRHNTADPLTSFWHKIGYFMYAEMAVIFMAIVFLTQLAIMNAVIWEIGHRRMVEKSRRMATSRLSILEQGQNQNQDQNASRMVVDDVESQNGLQNQDQKPKSPIMYKNRSQQTDITSIDA